MKSAAAIGWIAAAAALGTWGARRGDLRGAERVARIDRSRESASFRDRLRRGDRAPWAWPGLASAQVSWTWLDVLSGLHSPESAEGDFSWMFSKLNAIASVAPPREIRFLATLAPYYYVIGNDGAGATLLMNELSLRARDTDWLVWFWNSYHANENLRSPRLAGDFLLKAAHQPGAPDYLAPLALRLAKGSSFLEDARRAGALEQNVDPILLEKMKKARPEWFTRAGPSNN